MRRPDQVIPRLDDRKSRRLEQGVPKMALLSLRFAALRPTAVKCELCRKPSPPLSLSARCAPRERTGLTHAAPSTPKRERRALLGTPALRRCTPARDSTW